MCIAEIAPTDRETLTDSIVPHVQYFRQQQLLFLNALCKSVIQSVQRDYLDRSVVLRVIVKEDLILKY